MNEAMRRAASHRAPSAVHFNLSHSPPGVEHTLHLGSSKYKLRKHNWCTRWWHRRKLRLLREVPTEALTHYHPKLHLHTGTIQSYRITHPPKVGELDNLALLGIMVPRKVAQRAHQLFGFSQGLYTAKAQRLGLVPRPGPGAQTAADSAPQVPAWLSEGDLSKYHDLSEAAQNAVYHHNDLITLTSDPSDPQGSDNAVQILGLIESTPSFHNMVNSLDTQGIAQNLDGWNQGYQGWANAMPWKDGNGDPVTDKDGNPRYWYEYTPETNQVMTPVVQEAVRAVRNQENLDGASFQVNYGQQSAAPSSVSTAQVTDAETGLELSRIAAADDGLQFKLSDPDYHHGRQVVISETDGRQITFKVNNSYFRHLGLFVRFLGPPPSADKKGAPIKLSDIPAEQRPKANPNDTDVDSFQAWLTSRARVLGIPIEAASTAELTVTLPNAASSVEVLAGGMGIGGLPSSTATYEKVQIPGAVLTGVLDLGLPAIFLAIGAAGELLKSECNSALLGLASWIAETFAQEIAISAFPSGDVSKSDLQTDWAQDIIKSIITEAPEEFAAVLACAAVVAGEEDALEAVPIAGQIIFAINVAGTLAELAETTADVLLSPWVIPDEVTTLQNVAVTIHRDPDNFQFPADATQIKITATLSSSLSYDFTAKLTDLFPGYPAGVSVIQHAFSVPSGGSIQIDVSFSADNGWVAATGSVSAANLLPDGKNELPLSITIKQNPIPINSSTVYVHKNKLEYVNGQHQFVATAAPTATKTSLGGNAAIQLNDLSSVSINQKGRLGYAWRATSPKLVPVGQSSWPRGVDPTPLYTAQNINLDTSSSVDHDLRIVGTAGGVQSGFDQPAFVDYDLLGPTDGLHFLVAQVEDPSSGSKDYHAFKIDLDGTDPIDPAQLKSYGRFASQKLDAIAVHPRGFMVALNARAEKVELLRLPAAPYPTLSDALYATQTGGQGQYVGLLHGSRAIAVTKDGNSFLVLEEVNKRIQFFSVNGTSISDYLPNQQNPWIPLANQAEDQGLDITWAAMSMENTGFLYVLSFVNPGSDVDQYRMDIYNRAGDFVTRTKGIPAARLAVDKFRNVWTLNYELITGPNDRPEPSVSQWVGQNS